MNVYNEKILSCVNELSPRRNEALEKRNMFQKLTT